MLVIHPFLFFFMFVIQLFCFLTLYVGRFGCIRKSSPLGSIQICPYAIRDLEADMLREVCKDVNIEQELLHIGNIDLQNANNAEEARLDVSAVGLCFSCIVSIL